jgi:NTE family protein
MAEEIRVEKVKLADIENLVFQGGSIKGISYPGAYKTLLQAGLKLKQIKRVAGTSAGAIMAVLLSVGYAPDEILGLMERLNFKTFLDQDKANLQSALFELKDSQGSGFFAKSVSRTSDSTSSIASSILKNTFGLFEGEVLRLEAEKWINEKIKNTSYRENLTFAELHELHKQNPEQYKDLYMVGFNVNTGLAEVFSWETTPHAIISDAMRISMSIPVIFKPHQLYIKEGTERKLDPKKANQLYVDGGMTDNYPLFIFDQYKYLPQKIREGLIPGTRCPNPATLGFRLVSKDKRDFLLGETQDPPQQQIHAFLPYFKAILHGVYHKQESDHVLNQEQWRTVYIDTCGVNTLDFDLSDAKKLELVNSGEAAVREFFGLEPHIVPAASAALA